MKRFGKYSRCGVLHNISENTRKKGRVTPTSGCAWAHPSSPSGSRDLQSLPVAMVLVLLCYYYSKKKALEPKKKIREKSTGKQYGKKYGKKVRKKSTGKRYGKKVREKSMNKKYGGKGREPPPHTHTHTLPVAHARILPLLRSLPVALSVMRNDTFCTIVLLL